MQSEGLHSAVFEKGLVSWQVQTSCSGAGSRGAGEGSS